LKAELREGWLSLLASRGLASPDRRPLYAYRFARSEFDHIGEILRRHGTSALNDFYGAGLVVSHVAEWFRRERNGGHWDWIRPLRAIGLDYGSNTGVRYSEIESLVDRGLHIWRRPKPTGGERLLAIVREAGFPVASVREDPRISSWLKNAVIAAEKGFPVRNSVDAEAWRVSGRLAHALVEPATELCETIVRFRALLPADASDPVGTLDKLRPLWRDELPFNIESEDIRAMVEQIVRVREEGTTALSIKRYLLLVGTDWQPRASLNLTGVLDSRRLPQSVADAVKDGRRARIVPMSPFCEQPVAVAAIESCEREGTQANELRALVSGFDAPLCLEGAAKLAVLIGNGIAAEFIAPGGEALDGPVIAMHFERVDGSGAPKTLRILGTSPVKTSRPTLALAVRHDTFDSVSFSDGYTDLGECPTSGRRIVCFSGAAALTQNGVCWSWRTSVESSAVGRPILVGNLLHNSHESVFRGVPTLWIESNGLLSPTQRHEQYWRPRGRGTWRKIEGSKPWGRIDIALIFGGEMQFSTTASVVPPKFDAILDGVARELRVVGSDSLLLSARGAPHLHIRHDDGFSIVELGPPSCSPTVTIGLRWDAELELSFTDPSFELRLIDGSDSILPSRSTFAVDDLKGIRLCATRRIPVTLELRANDAPPLVINRVISGDVPLAAFANSVRQLLGSSGSLDARVDLTAMGGTKRIAEIRWYAEEIDPFDGPRNAVFSALASTHGLDLLGISLTQPSAGAVNVEAPACHSSMRDELGCSLPTGPWLIYGRRRNGLRIRPRILSASAGKCVAKPTTFERAISQDDPSRSTDALCKVYADPEGLLPEDRRKLIELLMLARREELPIASIDALRLLGHAPGVATRLLAECESLDERVALLEIQRDLPFLWCATSVKDWLQSFSKRICYVRQVSEEFGIDASIGYQRELVALREIVGLRPDLAAHANAVFFRVIVKEMTRKNQAIDGTTVHLPPIGRRDGLRRQIDRMVSRHEDVGPPPHNLLTVEHRERHRERWIPYDPSLADVISVPFALADHASGWISLGRDALKRCRDVWLYDPEYFEAIIPICLSAALQAGIAPVGEEHD